MRSKLTTFAEVLGAALVTGGAGLAFLPLGFMVAGGFMIAGGYLLGGSE